MMDFNSNDNQQQQGHERRRQQQQQNGSIYPHMMIMSNECNDTVTSNDDIEMQQHLHTQQQQRRHEQHPSIISDESLSSISTTMTNVSLDQQQQQQLQQVQQTQQQQLQVQQRFGLEIANITDSNSFFTYSDNSNSSRDSCNISSTNQTSRDYVNHDDDNILSRKYIHTTTDNITDSNSMIDTITTCTTSTTNENSNGNVPLHDMIYNFPINALNDPSRIQYYEEKIRVEAQLHPEHVNMYNHDGYTPFHIACYIGISYRIIVDLINIWPSVVTTPTQPLSLLLKSKPQPQQDKLTTSTRRRGRRHHQHRSRSPTLSSLSTTSMLPLHIVCRYCSNNSLVQHQIINLLVRIYPEATKIWTNNSSIIDIDHDHAIVGRSGSNDTTTDEIRTTIVPDDESYGDLPIHLYCQNTFGNNLRIIQLLIKTYPTSIQLFNRNGQLPIHIVCERHYFQRLDNNKKYNAMIQKTSTTSNETKTSTNIHCSTSYEILQYLISIYPKSIMIHDNKRNEIPFVTALRCKQPINTLEYLISLYPHATSCVDYKNRTPLHRYCNMIQNQMHANYCNKRMMIDNEYDGIEQDQYNINVLQLLLQYDDTNKIAGTIFDDQNYIPIQYLLLISSSSSIRRQNDDKNNSNNLSLLNIIYMLLRHYPNSIDPLRTNIIETKK